MEKINIVELLKDCPKGMELYSPLCGECRLIKIYDSLGFDVINGTNDVFNFSYDGRYNLNGECCIFPSKEQRDWSKFQISFNDGDIIYVKSKSILNTELVGIYKKEDKERIYDYCNVSLGSKSFYHHNVYGLIHKSVIDISRLATEDEKQKLFDAIKKNGYKWNADTKTLEKLVEPRFKVGDRVVKKDGISVPIIITGVGDTYYWSATENSYINVLPIADQDDWELVPNKFDINTLKPFDKVLVRLNNLNQWYATLFSHVENKHQYIGRNVTIAGKSYNQMIPYEGNEHLLGTTDNCDEFYKNWEK